MLRGVHHTAESNCTPRSQNLNLHFFQVAFKETYIIKEQICSIKCGFTKPKILTPQCHAHQRVKIFDLNDRISRRNRNRIQIRKSRDTLPLSRSGRALLSMFAQLNFDSDGSGSATWYSTLKNYWFVQLYILFAHPHCIL